MSKKLATINEVRSSLNKMEHQFKAALPSHIAPKKFIRVAMTAIQTTPALLSVDRSSLYGELIKCAQDGLVPDADEAVIIPYGKAARYQPMVKGICKKARNSGEIATLDAVVVYENDKYEAWIDEKGPHFKHVKARKNRGEPVLTYAYAITKDGAFYHEEIDEDQMSAIEKVSRGKDSPWKGPFRDEMKRKSALRRLAKYRLPSSSDIETIITRDDDLYDLDQDAEPPTPAKETDQPSKLEAMLGDDTDESPIDVTPDDVSEEEPPI